MVITAQSLRQNDDFIVFRLLTKPSSIIICFFVIKIVSFKKVNRKIRLDIIREVHAVASGNVIDIDDIREDILSDADCWSENLISREETNMEEEKIKMTIKMCEGNMSKAAQIL